ncbi:hypothetical protein EDD21DRAFT_413335 [Dissophora ornata]|nr:hypothetical protein EDD21DRAFT_413335 [Dissophora ornata]
MASAGSVNPLDIPEILFRVGQFIPLWSPKGSISSVGNVKYSFQPRDLLAAIAVNRTFHRTLTPLLWVVCTDYIVLLNVIDILEGGISAPFEIPLSCSHHFRFLEIGFRSIGNNIRFQCTHLQELKLSKRVVRDVGVDLISANKQLTLLSWDLPDMETELMQEKDYVALGGLKKLKVLQLRRWAVDLDRFLEAVLAPIAAELEELLLFNIKGFALHRFLAEIYTLNTRSVRAPFTTAASITTLPKLKTLLLDRLIGLIDGDGGLDDEVLELIRICPNLETLMIHLDNQCDTEKIGRYLRDYCPKLSAIRRVDKLESEYSLEGEDLVPLIQSCAPPSSSKSLSTIDSTRPEGQGLRVLEMGLGWLDSAITSALMAHSDCLETLILCFRSDEVEHFNNACQLLSQCRHLQWFEMHNFEIRLSPDDGMLLFQEPWACRGLKSLALSGFETEFEDDEDEDEDPDDVQRQPMQPYFEALDHYPEVVDEDAYDDGQIIDCGSSEQGPMGDISRNAALEITRCQNVLRSEETILGNWHRSTAGKNGDSNLLSEPGFEFNRMFFQVANSLPCLENVFLNGMAFVRGAAHEIPLE